MVLPDGGEVDGLAQFVRELDQERPRERDEIGAHRGRQPQDGRAEPHPSGRRGGDQQLLGRQRGDDALHGRARQRDPLRNLAEAQARPAAPRARAGSRRRARSPGPGSCPDPSLGSCRSRFSRCLATCLVAHPLIRFDQITVQKTPTGNKEARAAWSRRSRSKSTSCVPASKTTGSRRSATSIPRFAARLLARLTDFGEMRLSVMDKAGIARAALSVAGPGVQAERDAATAVRNARAANDFLAKEIAKRPDRYSGFAHLAMQDARAAADELERCMRELKLCGAMIDGHTNGQYLDHPSLYPFWERARGAGRADLHPSRRPGDTLARARRLRGVAARDLGMGLRDRLARAASSVRRPLRPLPARAHHSRPSRRNLAVSCSGASTAAPSSMASSSPSRRRSTSRRTSW